MNVLDDDLTEVAIQQACYYVIENVIANLEDVVKYLPDSLDKINEVISNLKNINNELFVKSDEMIEEINKKFKEEISENEN